MSVTMSSRPAPVSKTVGKNTDLPRLEGIDVLEPGAFAVKDDASGTYDLTGAHGSGSPLRRCPRTISFH